MNHNIQYTLHLIFQSKYKILYTFIVYLFILFIFNNENYLYCMMEDNNNGSDTLPIIENSTTKKKLSLDEMAPEYLTAHKRTNSDVCCIGEECDIFIIDDKPAIIDKKATLNYNDLSDKELFMLRNSHDFKIRELIQKRGLIFSQEIDFVLKNEYMLKQRIPYSTPDDYIIKDTLQLREQMFAMGDETFVDTNVESKAEEAIKRSK